MKRLSLAVLCLAAALPVLAADDFDKGCALYSSGRYNLALPIFQETIRKRPAYWGGHYYLAHTYLALGQKSAALEQYEICQNCHPSPQVAAACQSVAARLDATAAKLAGPDPATFSSAYRQQKQIEKQNIMNKVAGDAVELRERVGRGLPSTLYAPKSLDANPMQKQSQLAHDQAVMLDVEKKNNIDLNKAREKMLNIK